MKKRFLQFGLLLSCVFFVFSFSSCVWLFRLLYWPPLPSVYYRLSEDGSYAEVYGCSQNERELWIEDEYKGKPVTTITSRAFDSSFLRTVHIPASVSSISSEAFLSSGVSNIEVDAQNPYYASVDGNLYSFDKTAFLVYARGKSETAFRMPDTVTQIADYAFNNCQLKNVYLSDSVTSISDLAFENCYSLQYNEKLGLLYLGSENTPYLYLCGVQSRSELAFTAIDETCKYIKAEALAGCINLKNVTIPDSVTSISEECFRGCKSLQNVFIGEQSALSSIEDYAFQECYELPKIYIPNGVTAIGYGAFLWCYDLQNVVFGEQSALVTIGNYAFDGCFSLAKIEFPEGVTTIGESAFKECQSLERVEIPSSVVEIGEYAFSDCVNLKTLTLNGNSHLSAIEYAVFQGCSLTDVYITDIAAWCGMTFKGNIFTKNTTLYVNQQAVTDLVIPDTITSIPDFAFNGYCGLKSVRVPSSVTEIGTCAFSDCQNLENVEISEGLRTIDVWAFHGCSNLKTITLPDSVCFIAEEVFLLCDRLEHNEKDGLQYLGNPNNPCVYLVGVLDKTVASVSIDVGCKFIGAEAFQDCENLTEVNIPDGVISIDKRAFQGCIALQKVTLPKNLEVIGARAFKDCVSLTEMDIPLSVTSICETALEGCTGLTRVSCPLGVISGMPRANLETVICTSGEQITENMFLYCTRLKSITVSDSLREIGAYAFEGCVGLTEIRLPNTLSVIETHAFYSCRNLAEIYFEGTVAEWNAIVKGQAWNYNVSATKVICSDGEAVI